MPLTFAKLGEENRIIKIKGKDKTIQFLSSLGFIEGSSISIVSYNGGNLIVSIKDSRIAISQEMAHKIIVEGV